MEELYLVVGLGNPGQKYELTRHNAGFLTIDLLSDKHRIKVSKLKFKALYGEGEIEGKRVILVKPQTYMNLSGESVREIMGWYKIPPEHIILVYDDIDLPEGRIRIRPKGSAGTHNGMRSVIYQINTDEFPRVRIGIGRPPEGWNLADYVLGRFREESLDTVRDSIIRASEAVAGIIGSGTEAAMNKFNK